MPKVVSQKRKRRKNESLRILRKMKKTTAWKIKMTKMKMKQTKKKMMQEIKRSARRIKISNMQ
jgi:hypothetical protein